MRKTALLDVKRKNVAMGRSIPFPVEGWDTVSPIAEMSPKRALVMDNFIPRQAWGELRRGWASHSPTAGTGVVESLMAYQSNSGSDDALFAACDDGSGGYALYDVTETVSTAVVTGLSNSRFQHVNFTTTGGHFLYAVNGADDPQIWNGTAWSNPTITGATASDFIHINAFKKRLFFCANNKIGFYYLPVDSIQGAVSYYELGNVFSMGGYLMAMGTWTIDGGSGVDDHAVFYSSRGQIAVFAGTDPGDATAWRLVGVFNMPSPLGRRCMCKVGGDLYLVSVSGVLPLSRSLILDIAAVNNVAITQNISPTMTSSAQLYGENFGWQLIGYPRGTLAILNVPVTEGELSYQYVMNTLSGAWCRFLGQNAACWELFNDRLFFGAADGLVCEADVAASDGGVAITGDIKTAFNYFGMRGQQKRFPMLRPLITSDNRISPLVTLNVDFQDSIPSGVPSTNTNSAIYWNQFNWDAAYWPPAETTSSNWVSVSGIGYCAAVRLRAVASVSGIDAVWDLATWDQTEWDTSNSSPVVLKINGFDVTMERGGFI